MDASCGAERAHFQRQCARPPTDGGREIGVQVYRLGPKSGDTSDRNWEATTLNNKCWVLAESEADARQKVALATGSGPRLQRGATIPKSPWINRELTDCV